MCDEFHFLSKTRDGAERGEWMARGSRVHSFATHLRSRCGSNAFFDARTQGGIGTVDRVSVIEAVEVGPGQLKARRPVASAA